CSASGERCAAARRARKTCPTRPRSGRRRPITRWNTPRRWCEEASPFKEGERENDTRDCKMQSAKCKLHIVRRPLAECAGEARRGGALFNLHFALCTLHFAISSLFSSGPSSLKSGGAR